MRPIASILFALVIVCVASSDAAAARAATTASPAATEYAAPSVGFIQNEGQLSGAARYYALRPSGGVYFERGRVIVDHAPARGQGAGVAVGIEFPACGGQKPAPVGSDASRERVHSFRGRDSREWRSNLPVYREVRYKGIAPGADLVYRVDQSHLKYDVVLAPGASLSSVTLRYRGIESLEIASDGGLILHTEVGHLSEEAPVLYQDLPTGRVPIAGGYRLVSKTEIGYWAGAYDPTRPLVVDPGMIWSTFLGGSAADYTYAVASDLAGNIYVAGYSNSTDYPVSTGGYQRVKASGSDAVVTKLSADGRTAVWSTYLGGSGATEYAHGITVDSAGNVYVAGATMSTDFPVTTGAFRTTKSGGSYDGFVTKLGPLGDRLIYSTYLGGNGDDYALSIAFSGAGNVAVAGVTGSTAFPTTPGVVKSARSGVFPDASDGFVSMVNATGSALVYSTYIGGEGGSDGAYGVASDLQGVVTVVGWTAAPTFPTTSSAYDRTFACCKEGFVTRLNATGTGYVYSTFLGKSVEDTKEVELYAVAVDATGAATVCGRTNSSSFPTRNPFQASYGGGTYDAIVARLSSNGSSLVYSSYSGGGGDDEAYAVAVSSTGTACFAGFSDSGNYPTMSGAYDTSANGGADGFVTRLDSAGACAYSSYLGSSGADYGMGVVVLPSANVAVVGVTTGSGFPATAGAFDVGHSSPGMNDGFITVMDIGIGSSAGVETIIPAWLKIENPYPNPFPVQSAIRLSLDRDSWINLRIFNLQGALVRTLVQGPASAGAHRFVWDGRDNKGHQVATGVYLFQISGPGYHATRSALLIK